MKFPKKNIILVGMTGVGKTTIGKVLSRDIGTNFIDIDQEIEKITNLKIKDFFRIYGESEFRKLEEKCMLKFLNYKEKLIISPGAGILKNQILKEEIFKSSICIFLKAKISSIIFRLKKNLSNRPLLNKGKLEENLKEMYINRINDYEKSHITIDVDNISVSEVISKIKKKLASYDQTS